MVKPGTFSVIAKQVGGKKLVTYVADSGKGEFLVEQGKKAPEAMIQTAKEEASSTAMVLRFAGFLLMWFGLNLLAGPITTLLDAIPFLGSASRFVLGAVFLVVSLVLSAVWIVFAMIAHHPVVLILTIAAAGGGYYYYRQKKAKAGEAPVAGNSRDKHPGQGAGKSKPKDKELEDSVMVDDTAFESAADDGGAGGRAA